MQAANRALWNGLFAPCVMNGATSQVTACPSLWFWPIRMSRGTPPIAASLVGGEAERPRGPPVHDKWLFFHPRTVS